MLDCQPDSAAGDQPSRELGSIARYNQRGTPVIKTPLINFTSQNTAFRPHQSGH